MEKYLEILRQARKKGETIKIVEFYEKCKVDNFLPPKIMREVIKNNLQDVLVK